MVLPREKDREKEKVHAHWFATILTYTFGQDVCYGLRPRGTTNARRESRHMAVPFPLYSVAPLHSGSTQLLERCASMFVLQTTPDNHYSLSCCTVCLHHFTVLTQLHYQSNRYRFHNFQRQFPQPY